jgi:hypothetical protein
LPDQQEAENSRGPHRYTHLDPHLVGSEPGTAALP